MEKHLPKFIERDITTPKHGLVVYEDAYWACVDGDTKRALFWSDGRYHAPQCNINITIIEWSINEKQFGDLNVIPVHVPIAFVPYRN